MNNKDPIDISVLETYASNPADVAFFAGVFVRQTAADIEALSKAAVEESGYRWVDICHKIKGAAGMAGAPVMVALCLEGEVMEQASGPERAALCRRMEAAFDDVKNAFDRLSRAA